MKNLLFTTYILIFLGNMVCNLNASSDMDTQNVLYPTKHDCKSMKKDLEAPSKMNAKIAKTKNLNKRQQLIEQKDKLQRNYDTYCKIK